MVRLLGEVREREVRLRGEAPQKKKTTPFEIRKKLCHKTSSWGDVAE